VAALAAVVARADIPVSAAINIHSLQITDLNFDRYPGQNDLQGGTGGTIANKLFLSEGVEFTRDDGSAVMIYNWSVLGRSTTSAPNVLATVAFDGGNGYPRAAWSTSLT
jgi:hypothetical protein